MRRNARRPLHRVGRALLAVAAGAGLLAGAGPFTTAQSVRALSPVVSHMTNSRLDAARQASPSSPIDPNGYRTCSNEQLVSEYSNPDSGSAYAAGYADVSKLGGAAVLGLPDGAFSSTTSPGDEVFYAQAVPGPPGPSGDFYYCILGKLHLDYRGQPEFPPSTATFMAYGFVPVTGTVHITQVPGGPPLTVVEYRNRSDPSSDQNQTQPSTDVITAEVSVRLSDVKADGVPLDVGPDCHTIRPLSSPDPVADPENNLVVLTGGSAPGEPTPRIMGLVGSGGAVAGTATIPPFTGCGADGNLDPLIDAAVSGPGNYMKMMLSATCAGIGTQPEQGVCSPGSLKPPNAPLWTISHSGSFTSSATLTMSFPLPGNYLVTCDSEIAGTIGPDPGGLPPRDVLGSFSWTKISNCTGGPAGWSWTVTPTGTVTFAPGYVFGGEAVGDMYGISWSVDGTGPVKGGATGTCSFSFNDQAEQSYPVSGVGPPQFAFVNPSSFEMGSIPGPINGGAVTWLVAQITGGNYCYHSHILGAPAGIFGSAGATSTQVLISAAYQLPPGITITSP
jgi:hypothetical protein